MVAYTCHSSYSEDCDPGQPGQKQSIKGWESWLKPRKERKEGRKEGREREREGGKKEGRKESRHWNNNVTSFPCHYFSTYKQKEKARNTGCY
jgi:hypothetical protein